MSTTLHACAPTDFLTRTLQKKTKPKKVREKKDDRLHAAAETKQKSFY